MNKSKRIKIIGYSQQQNYTCGCATFRTALNSLGLLDVDESDLERLMGTTHQSGTHYDLMVESASKFGLEVKYGNKGTLKELDELLDNGWVIIVCFTIVGPHYSVYIGNNGNHLFLYDPNEDKKVAHPIKKFVKSYWKVDISEIKLLIAEYGLKIDESYNSDKWWIAYKK
jgi:predicted double-glycine peptidase